MQPRDQLTTKETQVATLVWEGLTNREIAKIIGTTEQVVKNYLRTAFDKLGVWSRLELALYVANHGGSTWASSKELKIRDRRSAAERGGPSGLCRTVEHCVERNRWAKPGSARDQRRPHWAPSGFRCHRHGDGGSGSDGRLAAGRTFMVRF
jgi:DNA-binding CsgD family transcriptional regulator